MIQTEYFQGTMCGVNVTSAFLLTEKANVLLPQDAGPIVVRGSSHSPCTGRMLWKSSSIQNPDDPREKIRSSRRSSCSLGEDQHRHCEEGSQIERYHKYRYSWFCFVLYSVSPNFPEVLGSQFFIHCHSLSIRGLSYSPSSFSLSVEKSLREPPIWHFKNETITRI